MKFFLQLFTVLKSFIGFSDLTPFTLINKKNLMMYGLKILKYYFYICVLQIINFSGPNTCYWVLPCCTFDFTTKYQRRNAGDSIFRDYLNFVTEIGCLAGFGVEEDKMRIPSTKRICLVGKPSDTNYEERKQKVLDFVEEKSRGFKPREKVEKVRNCTKIGNEIVTHIVNIVVNLCLETNQELIKESGETWNSGGELSFPQIVQRLQDNKIDLSKLKVNIEHQGRTQEFV